ncbi:hypothetical protein [Lysinibacillus fusiformis]|uniref:hypothetical protein n=1 Tax=Lysinibacillus fusiformis TaxID=28031 RepID=UPI0015E08B20|nr:hypothetical protein [Lysinibacillus fusiformis]
MKTKAIRSLRLANELAASGHRILWTEPCRDKPHLSVFIFEDSPAVQALLTRARRR